MDIQIEQRAYVEHLQDTIRVRIPLTFYPLAGQSCSLGTARLTGVSEGQGQEIDFNEAVIIAADEEGAVQPKSPIEISPRNSNGSNLLWFTIFISARHITPRAKIHLDLQLDFPPGRLVDVRIPLQMRADSGSVKCGPLKRSTSSAVPILTTVSLYILLGVLMYWNANRNVDVYMQIASQTHIAYSIGAVFGFLSLPTVRSIRHLTSIHGIISLFRFPELIFDRVYWKLVRHRSLLLVSVVLSIGVAYLVFFPLDTFLFPQPPRNSWVLYDTVNKRPIKASRLYRKDFSEDRYIYCLGPSLNEHGQIFPIGKLQFGPDPWIEKRDYTLDDSLGRGFRDSYNFSMDKLDASKTNTEYPNELISKVWACLLSKGFVTKGVTLDLKSATFAFNRPPTIKDYEIGNHIELLAQLAKQILTENARPGGDFHFHQWSAFEENLRKIDERSGLARYSAERTAFVGAIVRSWQLVKEKDPLTRCACLYAAAVLLQHVDVEGPVDILSSEPLKPFLQSISHQAISADRESVFLWNLLTVKLIDRTQNEALWKEYRQQAEAFLQKKGIEMISDFMWTFLATVGDRVEEPQFEPMRTYFSTRIARVPSNAVWPERLEKLKERFQNGAQESFLRRVVEESALLAISVQKTH